MRAHQRVLTARPGRDAQRGLAPLHALRERGGDHDQVVDLRPGMQVGAGHSVTEPSTQLTLPPPIQIVPAASRSTCTRLAQWLIGAGLAPERYIAAQGTALDRAGRVHVERDAAGTIWIGGGSVSCVEGSVTL